MNLEELSVKETLGFNYTKAESFRLGFELALKLAADNVEANIEVLDEAVDDYLDQGEIDVDNPDLFEIGINRQSILQLKNSKNL